MYLCIFSIVVKLPISQHTLRPWVGLLKSLVEGPPDMRSFFKKEKIIKKYMKFFMMSLGNTSV